MENKRRMVARVGLCLVMVVLVVVVVILIFGVTILNGYGKRKMERAFGEAYPGYTLRIGELDYKIGANRIVAQSITLSVGNSMIKVGRIS
ncbi:MAG: hypothetical protein EHM48_05390, partial [Planctomycetaceae bacterium]